jgi:hypothetical protein
MTYPKLFARIIGSITLAGVLGACNIVDSIVTPQSHDPIRRFVDVEIVFASGFVSDSVVVTSDGAIVFEGLGTSDHGNGYPSVCNFRIRDGIHHFNLRIPNGIGSGDTLCNTLGGGLTRLRALFNRESKVIRFEIEYITTYKNLQ